MGERADDGRPAGAADVGWQHDPFERHELRWWDGHRWTERVRDGDIVGIDRPGIHTAPRGATSHVPADAMSPLNRPVRWKSTRLPAMIAVSVLVLVVIVALAAVLAITG